MSANLSRTLRTVRHLRFTQILSRFRYLVERKMMFKSFRYAGLCAPIRRADPPPVEHAQSGGECDIERIERGFIKQLNWDFKIGYQQPNWLLGRCTHQRLWTATLHYHGWLSKLVRLKEESKANKAEELCRHYLSDWIARCALDKEGARDLAWNSYAIATRIAEWVAIHAVLGRRSTWLDFEPQFLSSLYQQVAYLHSHLEYDLRANHLMRDAVGLARAGRFFEGKQPRRWLNTATKLATEQAAEQVLSDGGHFERSPMYHLEVMRDIYSLAKLVEDKDARKQLIDTWLRMAEFANWMRHPDGNIPLLNDATFNGTHSPADVLALGRGLSVECDTSSRRGGKHFADTGIIVWHGTPWCLFFDVGPLGPDFQPGHGHADTLTLECSYKGTRLFVDPGTHSYDLDERRRYDRSTEAHNTVAIDSTDSSEVWHIFRVGRRAYPLDVYAKFAGGVFEASAGHDGYSYLSGRPKHFRRVECGPDTPLSISDRIEGGGRHRLSGGWLLDPRWSAKGTSQGWELKGPAGMLHITIAGPEGLKRLEKSCAYHPEFGMEHQTTRLCWELGAAVLPVKITTRIE